MNRMIFILLALVAGVVQADSKNDFLRAKIDSWFAEAEPVDKGLFVTDVKGCLYSVVDGDKGLQLIAMLTADKKPLCRKPAK